MDIGTIATSIGSSIGASVGVWKLLPYLVHRGQQRREGEPNFRQPTVGEMSQEQLDSRIQANVLRVVQDKFTPILDRQTEILEHMDKQQEKFCDVLRDNTTALQLFMKLEEDRVRWRQGLGGD